MNFNDKVFYLVSSHGGSAKPDVAFVCFTLIKLWFHVQFQFTIFLLLSWYEPALEWERGQIFYIDFFIESNEICWDDLKNV